MAGWYGLVDRVSVGAGRVDRDQLVAGPAGAVPAGPDLKHAAVFADQLLAVLAEAGWPERRRDVVDALSEDPSVARHGEGSGTA
jgi:hypothetical protein